MPIFAFEFWERVDEKKKDMPLYELADKAGMSYKTLLNQRASNRFPKLNDVKSIAQALSTTAEYLMTGKSSEVQHQEKGLSISDCAEAVAVYKDDRLKALVRACLRDPRLLEIISAVVESSERTIGKQA